MLNRIDAPVGTTGLRDTSLKPGLTPQTESENEALFEKEVFGAFTGTEMEKWLRFRGVQSVLIVGFYAHMCLSTCAREAMSLGFHVLLDPEATGSCDLENDDFGKQGADEVRRSALLHLTNMGAMVAHQPVHVLTAETARVAAD